MQVATGFRQTLLMTALGISALVGFSAAADAAAYSQIDLVSDIPGLATVTDPALKNPWGVSESATSPFWISDQGTNESTLYSVNAGVIIKNGLTVTIPTTASGPQGPTGQVNNSTTGFVVSGTGKPAAFIFANLNGTISAWNASADMTAVTEVPSTGASYTGLAIDKTTQQLYAADDKGGTIDVFNSSFQKVVLPPGAFVDPDLPAGLVPFNVQDIDGKIYVTYAPAGHVPQTEAVAGSGAIDVFSTSGTFISRLVTGGSLASPWGIALAPTSFGQFGGDLLVGNFSFVDSGINAFNPVTGALVGDIPIDVGVGNTAGGLWDLTFGNGGKGGNPNTLYFSEGINGEADGLFAAITPVPEPATMSLLLAPMLGLVALRRARYGKG